MLSELAEKLAEFQVWMSLMRTETVRTWHAYLTQVARYTLKGDLLMGTGGKLKKAFLTSLYFICTFPMMLASRYLIGEVDLEKEYSGGGK